MMLIDSNVLLYSVDTSSPRHSLCRSLVERAMSRELEAALVPQVLTEFVAVATSRRVGTALSPASAIEQTIDWRVAIPVRYPNSRCLEEFEALLPATRRSGQNVYDIFLAAQMRAHGIAAICTANTTDFAGVPGIEVRSPESV